MLPPRPGGGTGEAGATRTVAQAPRSGDIVGTGAAPARLTYPDLPMDAVDHHPLQPGAPAADPDQVATLAAALLDPALEPIVELVLHVDRTMPTPQYVASAVDGSVRFTRSVDGPAWRYDVVAVDRVATRWPTRPSTASAPRPTNGPTVARPHPGLLPVRLRDGLPDLRRTLVARPHLRAHLRPQLGGPGRSPRRARLAEHRASPGPVRARRGRACADSGWSRVPRRLVDVAPTLAG